MHAAQRRILGIYLLSLYVNVTRALQAALLLANGNCAPLAQLPSLSPSQWTLASVVPQILNVAMTSRQSCVHHMPMCD